MQRILLEFDFTDCDLAQAIADASPPPGVKIGQPENIVKASADCGGFFTTIAIWFKDDAHNVFLGILAAWLYDQFKNRNKKSCKINHSQVLLNKRNIIRLIKKQLAQNKRRETQHRRDKNRQLKKCR
jgi:hypothetical protein